MQYRVYILGGAALVLDVQSDFIETGTRIVAPLIPRDAAPPHIPRLKPQFDIAGIPHVMHTQELAAVPVALLRDPVADLTQDRDEITRALDIVFHGF